MNELGVTKLGNRVRRTDVKQQGKSLMGVTFISWFYSYLR